MPIFNGSVAKVLKSNNAKFAECDVVWGMIGTEEYSVVPPPMMQTVRKLENPYGLHPRLFVGALGVSGLAAYASFYEIGQPKEGETIFISAASGAAGQIVGQLAKREGLRVIGSVGSDEKSSLLRRNWVSMVGSTIRRNLLSLHCPDLRPRDWIFTTIM